MKLKKEFFLYAILVLSQLFPHQTYAQSNIFQNESFMKNTIIFLKKNIAESDKAKYNMYESYYLNLAKQDHYLLRIPFKDKSIKTDFIAIECDSFGNCFKGSIVHIIKNSLNNSFFDTVVIFNLARDRKWITYYTPDKVLSEDALAKIKVLDPVIIAATNDGKTFDVNLNVFAILNPEQIELMEDGGGFGVTPDGDTSGGFGTFSYYFDANLDYRNFLPPVVTEIEFERPNRPSLKDKRTD